MSVIGGFIVPGKPHPLLAPEKSEAWASIREAFEAARREIEASDADLLLLYSTQWLSVIGHQIQADPEPKWTLVDQDFHDLGEMPYRLRMDANFAASYQECATARGLHARTVAYHGFPIDTGTVVALSLLNPDNRLPACVVSCNMYADRAETMVLGKAAADALERTGQKAIAIAVTALSNRMFVEEINPKQDRISSLKDDEWNRKILEILEDGRLEDVSQLARQFTAQANADQKMKAIWWLAAVMGQHNGYDGYVFDYQPIWGSGAAVVGLMPSSKTAGNLEFDEEDVEVFGGDRGVLDASMDEGEDSTVEEDEEGTLSISVSAGEEVGTISVGGDEDETPAGTISVGGDEEPPPRPGGSEDGATIIRAKHAPRPVGAFPHARRVGNLLYLSGMGPRTPGTDEIPGGPVRDEQGRPLDYDIEAQTRAVIENIKTVLAASSSSLDRVIDVTCFLIDMDRDFESFNRVYAEYFEYVGATRTTLAIDALPTPIAVEFKVIATVGDA